MEARAERSDISIVGLRLGENQQLVAPSVKRGIDCLPRGREARLVMRIGDL
jgi:hypothetical protein